MNPKNHPLAKVCRVCGDRAIAFNFNGLTCESCKSFFRRNACKSNKFTCLKSENCSIDLNTRNLCKKCRLRKCFEIGMKKEMVLEKRNKKCKTQHSPDHEIEPQKPPTPLMDLIMKNFEDNDDKFSMDSDEAENIIANLGIFSQEIDLNVVEKCMIDEINEANAVNFVEELDLEIRGESSNFKDGLNLVAVYVRKIIKFAKTIPAFKPIDKEDQLLVIKPYFTEILLARFTFAYSSENDAFPVIGDEDSNFGKWLRIGILEEMQRFEFARAYRDFIVVCQEEMENDITIRNLIATLLLFRPREHISCPEYIRYHYFVYKRLLGRFLEHKYKDVYRAADKYEKLIHVLDEITRFRKGIAELYTMIEVQELTDVLTEIYEVKLKFESLSIS